MKHKVGKFSQMQTKSGFPVYLTDLYWSLKLNRVILGGLNRWMCDLVADFNANSLIFLQSL